MASGVKQPHLSDMEKNDKGLIPKRYIDFLFSRGLDLNSLFDDRMEVRLRPEEPSFPAAEVMQATHQHIQAAVTPPAIVELLRQFEQMVPFRALQQQLAKMQEEVALLKQSQKGTGPTKKKAN